MHDHPAIRSACLEPELPTKLAAIDSFKGLETAQLLSKAFPNIRYLWLMRQDKARQAISYQLASSTGQWWIIDDAEVVDSPARRGRGSKLAEPNFDLHAIARIEAPS